MFIFLSFCLDVINDVKASNTPCCIKIFSCYSVFLKVPQFIKWKWFGGFHMMLNMSIEVFICNYYLSQHCFLGITINIFHVYKDLSIHSESKNLRHQTSLKCFDSLCIFLWRVKDKRGSRVQLLPSDKMIWSYFVNMKD